MLIGKSNRKWVRFIFVAPKISKRNPKYLLLFVKKTGMPPSIQLGALQIQCIVYTMITFMILMVEYTPYRWPGRGQSWQNMPEFPPFLFFDKTDRILLLISEKGDGVWTLTLCKEYKTPITWCHSFLRNPENRVPSFKNVWYFNSNKPQVVTVSTS